MSGVSLLFVFMCYISCSRVVSVICSLRIVGNIISLYRQIVDIIQTLISSYQACFLKLYRTECLPFNDEWQSCHAVFLSCIPPNRKKSIMPKSIPAIASIA